MTTGSLSRPTARSDASGTVKLGALCWNQYADWPSLLDAGVRADRVGYDGIWTWDHLYPIGVSRDGPILEGWLTMTALAAETKRARIGLMVGANTFRNPALVAKMVTTLDHISNGRAVLGIGGAWFETEHRAYGLEFGESPGERLRWLEEAVPIMRRMLDGEPASGERLYATRNAINSPRPVQARLPILVGGSGERRTLRIVARHADACNVSGHPDRVRRKDDVLRRHCIDVGRDESEIERTVGLGVVVIRDQVREARKVFDSMSAQNGLRGRLRWRNRVGRLIRRDHARMWGDRFVGTPEQIAEKVRPYIDIGFRHLIASFPPPYDAETMERLITEVRPMLEAAHPSPRP